MVASVFIQGDLEQGAAQVLSQILPKWNIQGTKFTICTNGITNKLIQAEYGQHTVLIRIYGKGSDKLIDREQEVLVKTSNSEFEYLVSSRISTWVNWSIQEWNSLWLCSRTSL